MCASGSMPAASAGPDLHVVDGELPHINYPIVPGHEVVGRVESARPGCNHAQDRRAGRRSPGSDTLAANAAIAGAAGRTFATVPLFTGYTRDGGFATHLVADARYCFPLGDEGDDVAVAAFALRRSDRVAFPGNGRRGQASRHLRLRCGRAHYCPGGALAGAFGLCIARATVTSKRSAWRYRSAPIGPADRKARPPAQLDAAIIYAPVGALVPLALRAVRKGGRVVCAGIHMSDIPSFPYNILWEERQLLSVANLTRNDGIEFFKIAAQAGIKTHTAAFPCRRRTRSCRSCGQDRSRAPAVLRL